MYILIPTGSSLAGHRPRLCKISPFSRSTPLPSPHFTLPQFSLTILGLSKTFGFKINEDEVLLNFIELHQVRFKYTWVHVRVHQSKIARRCLLEQKLRSTWVETAWGALYRQVLLESSLQGEGELLCKLCSTVIILRKTLQKGNSCRKGNIPFFPGKMWKSWLHHSCLMF